MAKISNIIQQRFAIFTFYTRIHFEHWIPCWQWTGRRMEGPDSWVTCYPESSVVTFWVWDGLGIMGTEGWVVNGRALLLMDWLNPARAVLHSGIISIWDPLSLSHLQHALNKRKNHYSTNQYCLFGNHYNWYYVLPCVPGCTGGKVGWDAMEGGELPEYGYWSFVYFFLFATLKAQTLDVIQFLPKALPAN